MAMDAAHGASTLSQKRRPVFLELRSSKLLVVTTVCIAVFTDIFMYGVIVPIIPYALPARANVAPDQGMLRFLPSHALLSTLTDLPAKFNTGLLFS